MWEGAHPPNANRWGTVSTPFPVPVYSPVCHGAHAPWFFLFCNTKKPPHGGMAVRRLSEEVGNCLIFGQITGIKLVILALFGD